MILMILLSDFVLILSFLFFVLLRNCLILTNNYFAAVYPYRNQLILTKNYEFDRYLS